MHRYFVLLYSIFGYLFAFGTLLFLILWVYPWQFFPYNIDKAIIKLNFNPYVVDILLIIIFGLQHSIMAREFFKERVLGRFSNAIKAATYSVASSLALVLIYLFWQPIDEYIWKFDSGIWFWVFSALYFFGWIVAFLATFVIDHFELFGLHQGWREFKGLDEPKQEFMVKYFYKFVRHPIQAGTMLGLIATPQMSIGHLLFSLGFSLYIVIGLYFEEKSLKQEFGKDYEEYIKNTPMLIPIKFN